MPLRKYGKPENAGVHALLSKCSPGRGPASQSLAVASAQEAVQGGFESVLLVGCPASGT